MVKTLGEDQTFTHTFLKELEVAKKTIDPKISENLLLSLATNNIYTE